MLRKVLSVGVLLLAMIAVPRSSEAGLFEFIWELSGPRMIGGGFGCNYTFKMKQEDCRYGSTLQTRASEPISAEQKGSKGPFLFLGGSALTSIPHNDIGTFKANMLAFEPSLTFRSVGNSSRDTFRIYHAVGGSYSFLFGQEFRRFSKLAFTATPVQFEYKQFGIGVKIRVYKDAFRAEEFTTGSDMDHSGPRETTCGLTLTWIPNRK